MSSGRGWLIGVAVFTALLTRTLASQVIQPRVIAELRSKYKIVEENPEKREASESPIETKSGGAIASAPLISGILSSSDDSAITKPGEIESSKKSVRSIVLASSPTKEPPQLPSDEAFNAAAIAKLEEMRQPVFDVADIGGTALRIGKIVVRVMTIVLRVVGEFAKPPWAFLWLALLIQMERTFGVNILALIGQIMAPFGTQ
eukprot:c13327_g1_i1.p1 GENE.c13327_g1_i1~~c13327_g1_i1.p1  ORF type:complete len:202 (-),score=49.02 c13327_g1_i1:1-606(-)